MGLLLMLNRIGRLGYCVGLFMAGTSFATSAVAQAAENQTTATTPVADVASSASVKVSAISYQAGLLLGQIKLKTHEDREVDKAGNLLGINAVAHWDVGGVLLGAGLGYVSTTIKGSGDLIVGDQEASVRTPLLDLSGGYQFFSGFSGHLGTQLWFSKGADFAPKEDSKKNSSFYYLKLNYNPEPTAPVGFTLQYLKDLSNKDRDVTAMLLGVHTAFSF